MSLRAYRQPCAAGGCRIAAFVTCEGCATRGGTVEWSGAEHIASDVERAAKHGAAERARLRGFEQLDDGRWLCAECVAFEPVARRSGAA